MNDITKSRLVDALLEAEGVELENTKCVSMPSSAFSRRIQRIAEHPEKYTKKRRVKKIVIILIAAAVILTGCTAIKPIRTSIANFIVTIFKNGSYIDKSMDKTGKNSITEFYSPAFITDGYEFIRENIERLNSGRVVAYDIEYIKDDKKIVFSQFIKSSSLTLNTENTEMKSLTFNDIECLYYSNLGFGYYLWEKDGYRFILSAPDEINLETAKKIIESVKKSEFTNY